MANLAAIQAAFHDMQRALNRYGDGWIITVFPDGDSRVHGSAWVDTGYGNPPPTMWMSDEIYSMYCASIGIKNENMKR